MSIEKYIITYKAHDRCFGDTEESNPTIWRSVFTDYEELQNYLGNLYVQLTSEQKGYNKIKCIHVYSEGFSCECRASHDLPDWYFSETN